MNIRWKIECQYKQNLNWKEFERMKAKGYDGKQKMEDSRRSWFREVE